eukprot:TRINITY_DN43932_c0_g1_i1.p1 TRINITY_DN43932_c0_g1~~TRINITY_DN43932_c0_g1_i1.p1  ORF type:complete len:331 (+),score=25.76 TRINITY_DN43932_c0_g1_i1:49-993(+)
MAHARGLLQRPALIKHGMKVLALMMLGAPLAEGARRLEDEVSMSTSSDVDNTATLGANVSTGICFPWQDPPCSECLTAPGRQACNKALNVWTNRVVNVYEDVKGKIIHEKEYAETEYPEGSEEREQWRQSVVCRLATHSGIFVLGKAGCVTVLMLVASPACVAAGIPTGGIALAACGGAFSLICNAATTKAQVKLAVGGRGQQVCDRLGFLNPIPPEHRAWPALGEAEQEDEPHFVEPDESQFDFDACGKAVSGGVPREQSHWFSMAQPDADCKCVQGQVLAGDAPKCSGRKYNATKLLGLHCRCESELYLVGE